MDPIIEHAVRFVANATPMTLDNFGRSSLHYCCSIPSPDAITILLSFRSFNVNQMDCLGNTPLLCLLHEYSESSRHSVYNIAILLLQNGADPNIHTPTSLSPLMIAVLQKDLPLVKLLLQFGANPNNRLEEHTSLLVPARSSAFSLAVRPPLQKLLTETDIQLLWMPIHHVSVSTIFHAIQKVDAPIKTVVLKLMELRESKLV